MSERAPGAVEPETVPSWYDSDEERQMVSRFVCDSITEYALFTIAAEGTITSWNAGAEKIFGYARAEIVGRHVDLVFAAEDVANGAPAAELRIAAANGRVDRDAWHVRKDGSRFWASNTVQPLVDRGARKIGFVKVVRDRTQPQNAALSLRGSEERSRQSEERIRLLVDSIDHYAILAVAADGRITFWNAGAQRTYGYAPEDVLGKNIAALFTEEDRAAGIPESEMIQTRARGQVESELFQVRKDGSQFFAQRRMTQLQSSSAVPAGFAVTAHDITERRASEQTMWNQAFHDSLTGLANRALLIEHLHTAIARATRHPQQQMAVLFIDLDDFKGVNDEIGHVLADALLADVARRLLACVRPEDVVARMGGDEFAILLSEVEGSPAAIALAERVHATLATPFAIGGHHVAVTASIGVAFDASTFGDGAKLLLRDADVAMYEAKNRGRGQTVVFDDGLRARVVFQRLLEVDLRRALREDEIFLEFQPIVALHEMRLAGFEALVRWRHPSRGVLPAGAFIPTAEQMGSVVPIDHWVLRAACRQLRAWQQELDGAAGLTMSVNVSAHQFADDDLYARIVDALGESRIDGSSLKLEITESAMMERSARVRSRLAAIRELNVDIQIDDFGTGYSSLSYLRMFPVTAIKVDRSFVTGMEAHDDRAEMVRAIVTMAHNLRLTVIAEGIETPQELDALRDLACESGQGYLFSRSLGAVAARDFIVAHA